MVRIPFLVEGLGKLLDSAFIPMGVVTGVITGSFLLQYLIYSEWCLLWEDF